MKPSTLVGAAFVGLLLANVAPGSSSHAQSRPRSERRANARNCVSFAQERASDGRSITVTVDNRCAFEVESTIAWRLFCGDNDLGTAVERTERLTARQRRVVVANVDACGASSFSIEGMRWSWRNPSE
ncbi:MAG: hypothetical protein U0269_23075 [Polyangiales bacterium]